MLLVVWLKKASKRGGHGHSSLATPLDSDSSTGEHRPTVGCSTPSWLTWQSTNKHRTIVTYFIPSSFNTVFVSTPTWRIATVVRALITWVETDNSVFSRDVTAAVVMSLNKGTAAMLVSPTYPAGIELYSYANVFFFFGWKTCSLITWVKTLYILSVLFSFSKKDQQKGRGTPDKKPGSRQTKSR